jgi:hypothetical protein
MVPIKENVIVPFDSLTVDFLKKYMCEQEKFILKDFTNGLDLWIVDVDNVGNNVSTEDDIQKLGGKIMRSQDLFKTHFSNQPTLGNIHIIVQPQPPATTGKCLPMVYLSNKKFALSPILFIRLGKRKMIEEDDDEVRARKEKHQLLHEGIFF